MFCSLSLSPSFSYFILGKQYRCVWFITTTHALSDHRTRLRVLCAVGSCQCLRELCQCICIWLLFCSPSFCVCCCFNFCVIVVAVVHFFLFFLCYVCAFAIWNNVEKMKIFFHLFSKWNVLKIKQQHTMNIETKREKK